MLLSYYHVNISHLIADDSYLNVTTASSPHDLLQTSPGAIPFPYMSYLQANCNSFYTMNLANSPYIFGHLLNASDDLGLFGRAGHELELDNGEMAMVLSNYLSIYSAGLSYSVSSMSQIDGLSTEAQRIQFMKNEIDANRPVVVGLYDYYGATTAGHACVAYDYDTNYDGTYTFYYHCGWANSGKTHAVCTSNLYIYEVISLQINSGHSHSNSYSLNGSSVCPCQFISSHPNHTHSHSFSYSPASSQKHYAYCMCGHYNLQFHTFMFDPLQSHCDFCGAAN